MIDLDATASAISLLSTDPMAWMVIAPGILIGLLAGAIPGISASMAMVILLPFTLYMGFVPAILLLTSVFTGAGFGCAIPAILMKIPGTTAAVATTFDGFPMTEQGRHNEALGIGLMSSVIGCALSYVFLLLLIAPLASFVLLLGPLELFMIATWGLTLIAALGGASMAKGLLAGLLGLLIGTVGMSDTGYIRGTFGSPMLLDGVPAIPALMGLFVASQLLNSIGQDYIIGDAEDRKISLRRILAGMQLATRYPFILLKGSVIGALIGVVPGVGSSVSNLISYSVVRKGDRDPDSFGKGNPKGVIAAESGNSSSEGGSLTTLMALGIPGGGATAILLSAFMMHNIVGGPRFIREQTDIVYAIIFGNLVQTLVLLVIGVPFIYMACRIVQVPMRILIPSVLAMAVLGAFALTGNASGPVTLVVFAILGWLLTRFDYPVPATVIGLMLGPMVESELIRSYQVSGGAWSFILERPLAMLFAFLILVSVGGPSLLRGLRRARAGTETVAASLKAEGSRS